MVSFPGGQKLSPDETWLKRSFFRITIWKSRDGGPLVGISELQN